MSPNALFIYATASRLVANGTTISGQQLAALMDVHGFRTSYGSRYTGHGRGIHKAIDCAYSAVEYALGTAEAKKVAVAFTKADGTYAYKHHYE